ncbi:MAG TPA: hypothetical protein VF997_10140 [Polyangia bacterium]
MRATSLVVLCALAGCNFRIDPVAVVGGGGGEDGGSDGSVVIGGDDLGGDLGTTLVGDLAHGGPFLTIQSVPTPSSVDLTAISNADWAHWGYQFAGDFDDKAAGGGQISTFQQIGVNAPTQYGDGLVAYQWSDGNNGGGRHQKTPPAGTTSGVYVLTGGLKLTAPADTTVRRLLVYVGQLNAQGQLDAALGDNSAPSVSDHSYTSTNGTPINVTYILTYAAASPGQLLTVSWTVLNSAVGNITLQSASLQTPVP